MSVNNYCFTFTIDPYTLFMLLFIQWGNSTKLFIKMNKAVSYSGATTYIFCWLRCSSQQKTDLKKKQQCLACKWACALCLGPAPPHSPPPPSIDVLRLWVKVVDAVVVLCGFGGCVCFTYRLKPACQFKASPVSYGGMRGDMKAALSVMLGV